MSEEHRHQAFYECCYCHKLACMECDESLPELDPEKTAVKTIGGLKKCKACVKYEEELAIRTVRGFTAYLENQKMAGFIAGYSEVKVDPDNPRVAIFTVEMLQPIDYIKLKVP